MTYNPAAGAGNTFAVQAAAAAQMAAPPAPPPPVVQEVRRTGWIEKYSVGRGILPIKNWQRRWFSVDNHGLNYSKSQFEPPAKRTYVPFVTSTTSRDVFMNPVFLFPNVTKDIHSEASEGGTYYFALRFEENRVPRVLLLRTRVPEDRDSWVRYLAQYVHAAALTTGVPAYHPLSAAGQKKGYDPDELDAKEKKALRQVVLDWDEGAQLRSSGPGAVPDPIQEANSQTSTMTLNDAQVWGDDFDDDQPDPFGGGTVVAGKSGGGGGGGNGGLGSQGNYNSGTTAASRNGRKSVVSNVAAMNDDLL